MARVDALCGPLVLLPEGPLVGSGPAPPAATAARMRANGEHPGAAPHPAGAGVSSRHVPGPRWSPRREREDVAGVADADGPHKGLAPRGGDHLAHGLAALGSARV